MSEETKTGMEIATETFKALLSRALRSKIDRYFKASKDILTLDLRKNAYYGADFAIEHCGEENISVSDEIKKRYDVDRSEYQSRIAGAFEYGAMLAWDYIAPLAKSEEKSATHMVLGWFEKIQTLAEGLIPLENNTTHTNRAATIKVTARDAADFINNYLTIKEKGETNNE